MPSKMLLLCFALLLVTATACGEPESKLASIFEDLADAAESNKDSCETMGARIKAITDDNIDDLRALYTEIAKRDKEGSAACEKNAKSSECEKHKHAAWDRDDAVSRVERASARLRYYTDAFCTGNADLKAARALVTKASSDGLKAAH